MLSHRFSHSTLSAQHQECTPTPKRHFGSINLNDNTLDICVLNVTRAEGIPHLPPHNLLLTCPPQIPSNSLAGNPEMVILHLTKTLPFLTPQFRGQVQQLGNSRNICPRSIGEFYKICSFGHRKFRVPAKVESLIKCG